MANGSESNPVGTIATVVASVAMLRSAQKADGLGDEPTSHDPMALADRISVAEPSGGVKRLKYRFDQRQRNDARLGFPLAVIKKFIDDKVPLQSALIAYFGFFSIFPLILVFISVIGFVLDSDQQERLANAAGEQIPVVGQEIVRIVEENGQIGGSAISIVIGIGLALWSGLKMIDGMQVALNNVWSVPPAVRPNMLISRARGLVMLFVLGGGIIGSVVVSSLATYVDGIPVIGKIGIWAASALVSVLVYLAGYKLLTERDLSWRTLVPGAIFGGVAWWALQTFGAPLISAVGGNETYGRFAEIITLMMFFFIAAQLSILGAEINVVRARRLWPRSWTEGDLTPNDIRAYELLATSTQMDEAYAIRLVPSEYAPRAVNDD